LGGLGAVPPRHRDRGGRCGALVGPFPYEKLAHVESSTRFRWDGELDRHLLRGAAIVSRRLGEGIVAPRTGNQWFGDAVTERDFHDLWLSEGFADYFDLVVGAALDRRLGARARGWPPWRTATTDRPDQDRPVIDTAVKEPRGSSTRIAYNKGAWVLHMLRGTVGDTGCLAGHSQTITASTATRPVTRRGFPARDGARRPTGVSTGFSTSGCDGRASRASTVAWHWDRHQQRVSLEIDQAQRPHGPVQAAGR